MAKPALVALGAVLVIGGGAAAYWGATRPKTGGITPDAKAAMTSAIDQLDSDLRAAKTAAHQRAATLAELTPVQGVVSTDAATARDMLARGELKFSPQPGEVIELGQTLTGQPPATLVLQPEGGMRSAHSGVVGSYAELMGDRLAITEVVPVTPHTDADKLTGYVTVSAPLALAPAVERLAKAGLAGRLVIGGKTKDIGSAPAGGETITAELHSAPDAKLVIAVPPLVGGMIMPAVGGGAGAAGLGLILLVAGLVGGRKAVTRISGVALTELGNAATEITGNGAIPTPPPSASASMPLTANLGAGAAIGRWEIVKRLGSGGMADVYLARAKGDGGFEKLVAIKVMHPHLARNERAVDHFLDEAKLAARITHPNVVAIQDLGKIGTDYVIVMEYVDGVDLERLLLSARTAQRPVPVDVALGILCRICDGLNAAHHSTAADGTPQALVHRDVKSANVLVSKQGGVKVVDFGIAKAASQSHMTVAGETKGTPSMMAPEQRVGDVVDVRADVYSLGAVAYEILTGNGVNLDLAQLAHLGIDNWPHLPPLTQLRAELPRELDALVLGAMSYDRERRPADCAVLEAGFAAIMKQYGLTVSDKDVGRWVESEIKLLGSSAA